VGFRLACRSQAFQKQIRVSIILAGILGGLAFVAIWIAYTTAPWTSDLVGAVSAGVPFGLLFGIIFRRFFKTEMSKQQRKIIAEQFGGKPTIPCETLLRSDAVQVRQAGMEMTFPWTLCTGVKDNAGDVEINFSAGICVVRNRHFSSPAERQSFLDTARRLAG
jgi:hypothetical protein